MILRGLEKDLDDIPATDDVGRLRSFIEKTQRHLGRKSDGKGKGRRTAGCISDARVDNGASSSSVPRHVSELPQAESESESSALRSMGPAAGAHTAASSTEIGNDRRLRE